MLSAVMDVGGPVLPQPIEAAEEIEEVAHGRRKAAVRTRGAMRTATPTVTAAMRARLRWQPRRVPRASSTPVRKTPPPLAESAASVEDH